MTELAHADLQERDLRRLEDLAHQACSLTGEGVEGSSDFGELAVRYAQEILRLARLNESGAEVRARRALAELLRSPRNQRFSSALTDRIHRSSSASETVRALRELSQRAEVGSALPPLDRVQLRAARMFGPVVPELVRSAILHRLRAEASPYLWDAAEDQLEQKILETQDSGYEVNLNHLGEEVFGVREAQARLQTYVNLAQSSTVDALSVKLSGIDSQIDLVDFEATLTRLEESVAEILRAAERRDGGPPLVYFDMEAYRDFALTEALLHRLLRQAEFFAVPLGLAVQTYLPEAQHFILRLANSSAVRVEAGGVPLRVRLVKGANLHMERVEASTHRWEVPIFPSKPGVDANFKRTLRACLPDLEKGNLRLGVGSHNLFEVAYAALLRRRRKLEHAMNFEMLEGMAGPVGRVICRAEGQLLIYAPAVEEAHFSSAVSYLVRRLDENTAPENFLKVAPMMEPGDTVFVEQAQAFLAALAASNDAAPKTFRLQSRPRIAKGEHADKHELNGPFDNAAETDFTRAENRSWLEEHRRVALAQAGEIEVRPLVAFDGAQTHSSDDGFDPSRPDFSYRINWAAEDTVVRAIAVADTALPDWSGRSKEERARVIFAVGDALEEKRGELLAAMALDAGKRVAEADVEISEAVDFARYYAKAALELPESATPHGVVAVVPPWNFPLAIPLGGALAALAAGNTALLKPAPETPWVAFLAVSICHQAGVPREALQFIPCRNEDAGPVLEDQRVAAVILTGATATAQHFIRTRPRLRLFAETGGKNAAYVSPLSDRELAVGHIVQSAFGHAGQKCSALSVLILHDELFHDEQFRQSLVDAAQSLPVGSAWDLASRVTPLIRPPKGPLLQVLNEGEKFGHWLLRPEVSPDNPRLLSPGILWGVEPGSFPHQNELFGPVLSVVRASSFDDAMEILNQSSYGLTAGIFSLSESEQEQFAQRAEAGNLYINRGLTGAVVARQPFGGRKASCFGPGAKAGSAEYVLQLTTEKGAASQRSAPQGATQHAARVKDYLLAKASSISEVKEGTHVEGEQNYVRWVPGRTSLLLGPEVDLNDLRATLLARRISECRLPILVLPGAVELLDQDVFRRDRSNVLVVPEAQVAARCREMRVERVRAVGEIADDLIVRLVEAKISAVCEPVANSGKHELGYYLSPQSISFASHRYGNTKMGSMSRLRAALQIWS